MSYLMIVVSKLWLLAVWNRDTFAYNFVEIFYLLLLVFPSYSVDIVRSCACSQVLNNIFDWSSRSRSNFYLSLLICFCTTTPLPFVLIGSVYTLIVCHTIFCSWCLDHLCQSNTRSFAWLRNYGSWAYAKYPHTHTQRHVRDTVDGWSFAWLTLKDHLLLSGVLLFQSSSLSLFTAYSFRWKQRRFPENHLEYIFAGNKKNTKQN